MVNVTDSTVWTLGRSSKLEVIIMLMLIIIIYMSSNWKWEIVNLLTHENKNRSVNEIGLMAEHKT